ncbi:MAG: DUF2314 domain-containing protein [Pseudomonadota bacterium]
MRIGRLLPFILITAIVGYAYLSGEKTADNSGFVEVQGDDPDMDAAIAEARRTFSTVYVPCTQNPDGAVNFTLKVGVPHDNDGVEHIWVQNVSQGSEGTFRGRLANDPVRFEGKHGDPIEFTAEQISDWTFVLNGKTHGGYTIRALLPQLDPAEAKVIEASLAPLP